MIPLIDPQLDKWDMRLTGKNEWRIEQGELVGGGGDDKPHKLLLPLDADFFPSFECELDFTRRAGENGLNLNFPTANGDTHLMLQNPNQPGVFIRHRQTGAMPLSEAPLLETGKRTNVRVEVRRQQVGDRITVWNGDTPVGTWTGDRNELVSINNEGYEHRRRLSLWINGGSEFVFHRIRVRMLDGGNAETLRPIPSAASSSAPPLAIAPFDAQQAKAHQEAWAKHLGVPVEKEITLGRNQRGVDVKLTMILIPPGEFLMGSSEDEIGRLREQAPASGLRVEDLDKINLEGPQRRVRITKPFYLSKHEITTAQFRSFAQAQPGEYLTEPEKSGKGAWIVKIGPSERDPEFNWKRAAKKGPQGPDSPVVNVTWNDANDCCAWLSQLDAGLTFALPTEAQWEYACRAGSATLWSTGDEASSLENHAVIKANWPKDIGDRLPNAFGLCDMHGNVWEWCQDAFYDYRNAQNVDPIGAVSGEWRIIRGGSSFDGTGYSKNWSENNGCRSAVRETRRPGNPLFAVGFRAAAAISEEVIQAAIDRNKTPSPIQRPDDVPPSAIAPFDAAQARAHQEAWAKHLGVPAEYTNSIGMKFRLIPPGEFLMGSTPEEIEAALLEAAAFNEARKENIQGEVPRHRVILTQPFYLGVHEVTQAEYQQMTGTNPSYFGPQGPGKDLVAGMDTARFPAEMMSWHDAANFCVRLSEHEALRPCYSRDGESTKLREGTGYRLPSEAEWEFACRAGTSTRFWNGNEIENLMKSGWFSDNSTGRSHTVGELPANPFGLHDMHGNIWEWVQDGWDPRFYASLSESKSSNPLSPIDASASRGARGGNWHVPAMHCRAADRGAFDAKDVFGTVGFRLSLPVDAVKAAKP